MFTSHKEASVLTEGSARCSVTAACDISQVIRQAVKYAARLHINLILDLTQAAAVFSFTFDQQVQLKETLHSI